MVSQTFWTEIVEKMIEAIDDVVCEEDCGAANARTIAIMLRSSADRADEIAQGEN